MANYIAVIHKDAGSEYGVSFPDFPGCITAGKSVDEAKDMAQEALELHVDGMLEDGEDIPAPSSLDSVVQSEDTAGAVAYFVVNVAIRGEKVVRFNASMKSSLLERVDCYATEHGLSRSAFLARAAEHELGKR